MEDLLKIYYKHSKIVLFRAINYATYCLLALGIWSWFYSLVIYENSYIAGVGLGFLISSAIISLFLLIIYFPFAKKMLNDIHLFVIKKIKEEEKLNKVKKGKKNNGKN